MTTLELLTLLLALTGLLNFSVFLMQLRAVQRQVESARQQPEIALVQRAMSETSDHLKILVERPYLRPYFYENKVWAEGDRASHDEVKAMAELLLNTFAYSLINAASFQQYPVRSVKQTIRFYLRNSPAMRDFLLEGFDRFPITGLALLYLKNDTKAETEEDMRALLAMPRIDEYELARRERLLHDIRSAEKIDPLELAKDSLEKARALSL